MESRLGYDSIGKLNFPSRGPGKNVNIKDWLEIEPDTAEAIVVAIFGCLAPGILSVLLFKPEFLVELNVVTLLLLAASISGPIVIFNVTLLSGLRGSKIDNATVSAGSIFTMLIFMASLQPSYVYELDVKKFVTVFIALMSLNSLLMVLAVRLLKLKAKNKMLEIQDKADARFEKLEQQLLDAIDKAKSPEALPPEDSQGPQ